MVVSLAKRTWLLFFTMAITAINGVAYASIADDLRDGHHILMMRHADAPGFSDPAGYRLEQCDTQRNLGEFGKKQALMTGQWLSQQGIDRAQVYSSPWCRCIDTATLLNKGPVVIDPALGSFFGNMSLADKQTNALRAQVKMRLKQYPKTPIIMVSHHVNIEAFTGVVLGSGDMILVRVDRDGRSIGHRVLPALRKEPH